jgi:Icc-related predicted phosphoesterase
MSVFDTTIYKFTFISDTHNQHDKLNLVATDVLVHCGDAGTKGNFTEGKNFLMWFVKQRARYKLLCPGNHDGKLRGNTAHPDLVTLAEDLGIIVLNDDFVSIDKISIYGVSATFKEHGKATKSGYLPTLEERKEAWKNIPSNLDLLVTHMPPYGILDTTEDGRHIGCKMLLDKVKEIQPRMHTFGHIHERAGATATAFNTDFYNMACMNRSYELITKEGYSVYVQSQT